MLPAWPATTHASHDGNSVVVVDVVVVGVVVVDVVLVVVCVVTVVPAVVTAVVSGMVVVVVPLVVVVVVCGVVVVSSTTVVVVVVAVGVVVVTVVLVVVGARLRGAVLVTATMTKGTKMREMTKTAKKITPHAGVVECLREDIFAGFNNKIQYIEIRYAHTTQILLSLFDAARLRKYVVCQCNNIIISFPRPCIRAEMK